MLLCKKTKWLVCVHITYLSLKGTGHMFIDLGLTLMGLGLVVYWLRESKGSLQLFSRWIAVSRVTRLEFSPPPAEAQREYPLSNVSAGTLRTADFYNELLNL